MDYDETFACLPPLGLNSKEEDFDNESCQNFQIFMKSISKKFSLVQHVYGRSQRGF